MKLSYLIKRLQDIKDGIKGDPDIVIDYDENGYFNLEGVKEIVEDSEIMINLKSSNEM